jgi:hypothetical protein
LSPPASRDRLRIGFGIESNFQIMNSSEGKHY